MKRSVTRILGIFFLTMLTTTFGAELTPKAGIRGAAAAQKPPDTIRSTKPYDNSVKSKDFKVESVFVSEANAPDVPISTYTVGGNYLLNCEVSYTGANAGNCAGGTRAYVLFKLDGNNLYDGAVCLVPNQKQIHHAGLSPQMKAQAFSTGTHTYECIVADALFSQDTDSTPNNNVKRMIYTIK
jgi:hypothetical protein